MTEPQSPQQTTSFSTDEALWSIKIVMAKTGLSRASIYDYVAHGHFPQQRRIGPNRVAWFASEVRAWVSSRPQARQDRAAKSDGSGR
jgi:prophage regulatory protein